MRLAAHLLARGALADHPRPCSPRGREAATAMLACLLAGVGYLPLDPEGPRGRTTGI